MSTSTLAQQFTRAYRAMAQTVRYRPATGGGGGGSPVTEAEVRRYAERWWAEENDGTYLIGCPDYDDREALIWLVEAARMLCAVDRSRAAQLARMAADELERGLARASRDEL